MVRDLISHVVDVRPASDGADRIHEADLLELKLVWDYSDTNFPPLATPLIELLDPLLFEVEVHIGLKVWYRKLLAVQVYAHCGRCAARQIVDALRKQCDSIIVEVFQLEFLEVRLESYLCEINFVT